MNYSEIVGLTSGLLQFVVAWYALRLNRFLDRARLGWVLFSAFALLALLHLLLPVNLFRGNIELGVKLEVLSALFSVLLLIGMFHLESRFKKQMHADNHVQREASRWESELQDQIDELTRNNQELSKAKEELTKTKDELTRANAELIQSRDELARTHAESLQAKAAVEAEVDRFKTAQAESERQTLEMARTNDELQQIATGLQNQLNEQKQIQIELEKAYEDLVFAAREAGATLGSAVKGANLSVSLLASHVARSRVGSVSRIAKLMRGHARTYAMLKRREVRDKRLPDCLTRLAHHLSREQALLLKQIDAVKNHLDAIKEIAKAQKSRGKIAEPEESAPVSNTAEDLTSTADIPVETEIKPSQYDLQDGQTQTATTTSETEPAPELQSESPVPETPTVDLLG